MGSLKPNLMPQQTAVLGVSFFRRVTDDTVHASDRELTSTTSNRSRLGEGEGRRNPDRDEDLGENLISLKPNARTIENGQGTIATSVKF